MISLRLRLALLLCFAVVRPLHAGREIQELTAGWKFLKHDTDLTASTTDWQGVTVPHTWNAADGQLGQVVSGTYNYYRGAGWYERTLAIPEGWRGRRVFIRFEAASLVAKTWLNGHLLGEHDGAFTAFCYELTPFLKFGGVNELRVRVNNERRTDIPPLTGDFNLNGGLYRPVHLIVTDAVCVSPLDFASPGVYLTTRDIKPDAATVGVRSILSNGLEAAASIQVETRITDPAGKIVATNREDVALAPGETKPLTQTITIPGPHLWNGRKDPYLYHASVAVLREGRTVDEVRQPLGLRTVAITQDQGFLLKRRALSHSRCQPPPGAQRPGLGAHSRKPPGGCPSHSRHGCHGRTARALSAERLLARSLRPERPPALERTPSCRHCHAHAGIQREC